MAISSYTELRTTIEAYIKRTDALTYIDMFIGLCEDEVARSLRVPEMETRATASTSTTSRFVALPTGYLEMLTMRLEVAGEQFNLTDTNISALKVKSSAGVPCRFTVTSQIELDRKSDTAYTLEMSYYQSPTGLSSSNASNDILANYPMLYLAGAMKFYAEWAVDYSVSQYWSQRFSNELNKANFAAKKHKYQRPSVVISSGVV